MNRTVLAIGAVAALAAVYVFLISPLEDSGLPLLSLPPRAEMQERLPIEYMTLYKYQKVFSERDRIGPRLQETRDELSNIEKNIFPKTDVSVAFAKLQADVQGMASAGGLTVTSVKPLPTLSYRHYTGMPLFIDCTGNIDGLGKFLKKLDSDNVFYRIDRLNVASQQDGSLRIKMQLSGLMAGA